MTDDQNIGGNWSWTSQQRVKHKSQGQQQEDADSESTCQTNKKKDIAQVPEEEDVQATAGVIPTLGIAGEQVCDVYHTANASMEEHSNPYKWWKHNWQFRAKQLRS